MATAIIDLGEDWSIPETVPPERRAASRRPLFAALIALAALLPAGAGAVRPVFQAVAEVPVGQPMMMQLSAGALYVVASGASLALSQGPGVVAGYRLPGGTPGWRTELSQPIGDLRLAPGAGVLFVVERSADVVVDRLVALDTATGRQLWSAPATDLAEPVAQRPEGLLYRQDPAGEISGLSWVDLRTGRVIWSRPVPARGSYTLLPPDRLLLTAPDGGAQIVAEQTGAVLGTGQLGNLRPPPGQELDTGFGDGQEALVQVVGDRILVLRPEPAGRTGLSAFDATTLSPQWTVNGEFYGYPEPCEPLICLAGASELTALDPATGRVVWRSTRWQDAMVLAGGRLLAAAHRVGVPLAVLDAGTGRMLFELGNWTVVPDLGSGGVGLLVRPDTEQVGRLWFGSADAPDAVRLLGYLSGMASGSCQVTGDLLACQTLHRTVRIWRYRS